MHLFHHCFDHRCVTTERRSHKPVIPRLLLLLLLLLLMRMLLPVEVGCRKKEAAQAAAHYRHIGNTC